MKESREKILLCSVLITILSLLVRNQLIDQEEGRRRRRRKNEEELREEEEGWVDDALSCG